ncbi:unnamed protein product [Rotaria socialis]|uniref:Fringe-like glycosyltransferase domain-containing protein n=2 Tax=Rotaria socialis TaxID=392032 RepID=A0A817T1W5_9BILA|nr:unnamed protein product [Rotaria socialis]CAF3315019.1 unnamed protein product [Rotaria socialis]CAF3332387.1 unnamed protein product [Rotaria socialis]CAF3336153.1 unnamed protein product [Rotaria socialis]CAF3457422.1 unnamed protein product [Rotaria socialis]
MSLLTNLSYHKRLLIIFLSFLFIYYNLLTQTKNSEIINQTAKPIRILYLIRTAAHFYRIRLIYLLQTWISLVKDDVFFTSDLLLPNISETHMILTKEVCGSEAHSMNILCCKTAHDFIIYHRYLSKYDWFCHFDDDQYVNVNKLKEYLSTLDSNQPYYVGRASWSDTIKRSKEPFPYPFWFATLGAGVCLSKHSISLLEPYTQSVSAFIDGCINENYHDDIYLAFLLNGYLNISLTQNSHFHSHLEKSFYHDKQTFLRTFKNEITFGFGKPDRYPHFLPRLYQSNLDPYRIRTLHCLLNTQLKECERKIQQHLFNSTK